MENQYITVKHFKKLMTSQPFFIWNTLEPKDEENEVIDHSNFWSNIVDEVEAATYNEVSARTIQRFDKWLRDKMLLEKDCVIIRGSKEEQIEKTKEALMGSKLIISPVFEYKGALASPFAFDPVEKKVYYIKYSKKTKISDLINPYWDFCIIQKHIQVREIKLFLPVVKYYRKGEIELRGIDSVNPTKTGKLPFTRNSKGDITDIKIIDFCRRPLIKNFNFPNFDDALKKINESKNSKLDVGKINFDFEQIGQNPLKNALLSELGFKYADWSGILIPKKNILEYYESDNYSVFQSPVLDTIESIDSAKITDPDSSIVEYERIKKSNRVIWYDFEGYSLPFSPLDGVLPHQQLVFQLSVVETIKNIETRVNNLVIDPKSISIDDLYKIIVEVYSEGADAYVVYNKGYEIPRMREICNLLRDEGHNNYKKAYEMLDEIEEKTVDLMKVFKISSKNNIPPILLNDQKGKASIKNIEKHISSNNINLPRPIRQYAQLDVKNGGMAMEIGIHRALGIIGDNEWKNKVNSLKEYCENDVRAMIMVYDFIEKIINEVN